MYQLWIAHTDLQLSDKAVEDDQYYAHTSEWIKGSSS